MMTRADWIRTPQSVKDSFMVLLVTAMQVVNAQLPERGPEYMVEAMKNLDEVVKWTMGEVKHWRQS